MAKRKKVVTNNFLNAVDNMQRALNRESFRAFYGDRKAAARHADLEKLKTRMLKDAHKYEPK